MAYPSYSADATLCGFIFVNDAQVRFLYDAGTVTPSSDTEADLLAALADRGLVTVVE